MSITRHVCAAACAVTIFAAASCTLLGCHADPANGGGLVRHTAAAPAPIAEMLRTDADADAWHEIAGVRVLEVEHGPHNAALPLVVFIHGHSGNANLSWLEGLDDQARFVFPQGTLIAPPGYAWFTHGPGGDPKALAHDVEQAREPLARAIAQLAQERPTLGKPIVVGFSQGAVMAYALAFAHPDMFSLSIPISGELPAPIYDALPVPGVRYPPVHALHGMDDDTVLLAPTAAMVDTLAQRHMDVTLDKFSGAQHEITPAMRARMLSFIHAGIQHAESANRSLPTAAVP